MRVYIIRHADAVEGAEDESRALSGRGKREMRAVAGVLRGLKIRVKAIWHSGLVRARQSAQFVEPVVQSDQGIVEQDGLAPLDKAGPLCRRIEECKKDLIIVGHEPLLGKVISRLASGKASREVVKLRKGAVACLECEEGKWRLEWMITPELAGEMEKKR